MSLEIVPFVTLRINGCVISAECSVCHDLLGMGEGVGTPDEQERKMWAAFKRHVLILHAPGSSTPAPHTELLLKHFWK